MYCGLSVKTITLKAAWHAKIVSAFVLPLHLRVWLAKTRRPQIEPHGWRHHYTGGIGSLVSPLFICDYARIVMFTSVRITKIKMSHGQPGWSFWLSSKILVVCISCYNLKKKKKKKKKKKTTCDQCSGLSADYSQFMNNKIIWVWSNYAKNSNFWLLIFGCPLDNRIIILGCPYSFGCLGRTDNQYFESWCSHSQRF